MSNKKAFTLIEIMVVLIIVSALACIAIPNYYTFMEQGMAQNAQNIVTSVASAEKSYYFQYGAFCDNNGTDTCGNSLTNLVTHLGMNSSITDSNYSYYCETTANPNFRCVATRTISSAASQPSLKFDSSGFTTPSGSNAKLVCVANASYANYCPSNTPVLND